MHHFELIYLPFPDVIRGIIPGVTKREGDQYVVLIDSTQSEEQQNRTIRHELSHIRLGHFDDERTATDQTYLANIHSIEDEANEYADRMTDDELNHLMTFATCTVRRQGHFDSEYRFVPA